MGNKNNSKTFSGELWLDTPGHAHAVVLWMDYKVIDSIFWSTGLSESNEFVDYFRQGVYFLKNPKYCKVNHGITFNLMIQKRECDIVFHFQS